MLLGCHCFIELVTYCRIIVPILCWTYLYLSKKYDHCSSDVHIAAGKRLVFLGNTILVTHALFAGFMVLAFAFTRDSCHSEVCLQDYPEHMLPFGLLCYVVGTSIAMPMFFRAHTVKACILSVSISCSMVFASAILLKVSTVDVISIAWFSILVFLRLP